MNVIFIGLGFPFNCDSFLQIQQTSCPVRRDVVECSNLEDARFLSVARDIFLQRRVGRIELPRRSSRERELVQSECNVSYANSLEDTEM